MSQVLSQETARDIRHTAHDQLFVVVQESGRLPRDLDDSDNERLNAAWNAAVGGDYCAFTNGWAERAVCEASKRSGEPGTTGAVSTDAQSNVSRIDFHRDVRTRARNELLASLQWSGRVPGFFSKADLTLEEIRQAYDFAVGGDYQSYVRGWAERAAYEAGLPVNLGSPQTDVVRDAIRARFVEHLRATVGVEQLGLDAESLANGMMDIIPQAVFSEMVSLPAANEKPALSNLDDRLAVDRTSMSPENEGAVYVAFEKRTVAAYAISAPNQKAALARARLALRPQGHSIYRAEQIVESTVEVVPESGRIVSFDELHSMLDSATSTTHDRYAETVFQRESLTKAFMTAAHQSRSEHEGIEGFFYAPDITAGINAILDGVGLGVRAFEAVSSDEALSTDISPPSL